MTGRIYSEPANLGREDLKRALAERDIWLLREAIVAVSLSDPDRRWVEHQLVDLMRDPDGSVRSIAALGVGHVARVHGSIDRDLVLPVLRELLGDAKARGNAENALDDIAMFARIAE